MANASRVLQAWSEQTDAPMARLDAVFRALQREGMAPKSGKGGGAAAVHWDEHPLVNHALAMAAVDVATTAPRVAQEYRALGFIDRQILRPVYRDDVQIGQTEEVMLDRSMPEINRLLMPHRFDEHLVFSGNTLGDFVGDILVQMARSDAVADAVKQSGLSITVFRKRALAYINFTTPDGARFSDTYALVEQEPIPGLSDADRPSDKLAAISYTAIIGSATLEMLAGLLRDTFKLRGDLLPLTPSDDEGSTLTSKNENAAPARAALPTTSLPSDPQRNHTQKSSLNNCDHTGCVYAPSIGIDSAADSLQHRSRSHDRASDHHAYA